MTSLPGTMKEVGRQLEEDRWAATQERHTALMNSPAKDLADLSDAEFNDGLRRLKLVQERMKKIIDTALIKDVHYGREKDRNGKDVFKKDRLKRAGAEELRRLMRFTVKDIAAPDTVITDDFVSVTVTCGLFDSFGRQVASWSSNCNTKEKRFRKYDGSGFTYSDPREALHDCISMARKRCSSHLTEEASGATGFFADGDDMHAALDDDKVITPMTASEKTRIMEAAAKRGMGRSQLVALTIDELGRDEVASGDEVAQMLERIGRWEKPAKAAPASDRPAASDGAPPGRDGGLYLDDEGGA